jgi:SAM-dependent methyltransferase
MTATSVRVQASLDADPRANLVGAVARICTADPSIPVHDLYDQGGAGFYDALAFACYDTATPVALAEQTGGPVLDLACGSGRIGLALARRGHAVVGVDLSAAMIGRFADRLDREPPAVAARVTLTEADIHDFALPDRFCLAVLGATTVVLVDPGQRVAFFERVRGHLAAGGTFALDVAPCDLAGLARQPERLSAIDVATGGGAGLAVCAQQFDVRARAERTAFYVEDVDRSGTWQRRAVTTQKAILTPDEVVADLTAAGFRVTRRPASGSSADAYEWLVAIAPDGGRDR